MALLSVRNLPSVVSKAGTLEKKIKQIQIIFLPRNFSYLIIFAMIQKILINVETYVRLRDRWAHDYFCKQEFMTRKLAIDKFRN